MSERHRRRWWQRRFMVIPYGRWLLDPASRPVRHRRVEG